MIANDDLCGILRDLANTFLRPFRTQAYGDDLFIGVAIHYLSI